jgi:hypothetical protein
MEINFFYGKHKLNIFRIQFKAYLLDLEDISEEKLISKKDNEFGTWLDENLLKKYKSFPEVIKILEIYENIYIYAKKTLRLIKENSEEAKSEFAKIDRAIKNIFSLLDKVEDEIKVYQEN